ncbi:MAG: CAAX prenyl protease-related protein [Chthoniobacteraceae bacterium]|nr:CAAX prenyl protease-related protein [Chthoniobacteraceae bacterium]
MNTRSLTRYCAPFVLFLLLLACTGLLQRLGISNSQYWLYPLQTLLCAMLVWLWRREYPLARPRGAGLTLAIGVLAFGLWVSPQAIFGMQPRLDGFNPEVFAPGSPAYWATVGFRFARLVVVVPLVEEIFWRGFLLRYLVREDFTSVPFGTFTWYSFGFVTLFFALEHQPADYPAALCTGALYNLLAVRTRSLSACVVAHAVTNLLLGGYVMATRQWGFW